jgi:hypothetical protein
LPRVVSRPSRFSALAASPKLPPAITRTPASWRSSRVAESSLYSGEGGYPAIIDRERWQHIVAALPQLDGANRRAVSHVREGGRPTPEAYLLRGVATCACCGASLCIRHLAAGRRYLCKHVREASGIEEGLGSAWTARATGRRGRA